jgi:hypothetical protein
VAEEGQVVQAAKGWEAFHEYIHFLFGASEKIMIRKLKSGEFRLYSRKKDSDTGKRRNLGTFSTLEKAKQHERQVQYFKKH